jgi:rubrerythrin
MKHLMDSIREYGIADGITVAANGESISGSARLETLATLMPNVKIVEVETYGETQLVNRRMDIPNTDDPRAQLLSAAVNIVARNNYDPDGALLASLATDDDILKRMIEADEMSMKAVMDVANESVQPPADFGEYGENIEIAYCCPRCGYKWSGKPNQDGQAAL